MCLRLVGLRLERTIGTMAATEQSGIVRTFLVEDQYFTAEGILKTLRGESRLSILGHFASAEEALAGETAARADVALVDLGLPRMNGMELTRELLAINPELKVIWLTAYPVIELVETAKAFGAGAVLYKTCFPQELIEAIFKVHSGGNECRQEEKREPKMPIPADKEVEQLSARQKQILSLVAQGFITKEIADRLELSPRTVESHRVAIMRRLHSETVADLTRIACRNGLAPL